MKAFPTQAAKGKRPAAPGFRTARLASFKRQGLLILLASTPMGISEIMKEIGITTRAGAHYIIKPLIENKLIVRKGGHKTGKYIVV
jgi:predicted transcriptional regulator